MADLDDRLKLELEGPGLNPDTVDPLLIIGLARSYFELLGEIAKQHGSALNLRGFRIEDKCVAAVTIPHDLNVAHQVATDASRYIGGALTPPPEVEKKTRAVRRILKSLPMDFHANVLVGPWPKQPLMATRKEVKLPPLEITELRVFMISIGGRRPGARFSSRSEGNKPFSVRVEAEKAKALARWLYSCLDVTVQLERDEFGRIHSGELLEFEPVNEVLDDLEAWKDWFRTEAKGWDEVKDIEAELGRVRS